MSYEQPNFVMTLEAAGDLSGSQYRFVKVSGGQTVAAVAAATDFPIGVLQNKPGAAGRAATIYSEGISKVVAGAAITAGVPVMLDAVGRVVTATATNRICGVALQSASALGDIIAVYITRGTL